MNVKRIIIILFSLLGAHTSSAAASPLVPSVGDGTRSPPRHFSNVSLIFPHNTPIQGSSVCFVRAYSNSVLQGVHIHEGNGHTGILDECSAAQP